MPSLDRLPLPLHRRRLLAYGLGAVAAVQFGPLDAALGQEANAYTFLVLGLDTLENDDEGRSDIIILARVDPGAGTVRALSIPRDLYVEIPGHGYDKINAAWPIGLAASPDRNWLDGAALASETIELNLGVPVDGVAMTTMSRFPAIIDAVGGIDVDNPYAVDDPSWPEAGFPAGPLHLDGATALVFMRTRQVDGDGGRVMRQHLVLEALLARLQEPDTLASLPDLVVSLSGAVRTDIPVDVQLRLATMLPDLTPESLAFDNIDDQLWAGTTDAGAWIYQADWTTLPGNVQAWLDGEGD